MKEKIKQAFDSYIESFLPSDYRGEINLDYVRFINGLNHLKDDVLKDLPNDHKKPVKFSNRDRMAIINCINNAEINDDIDENEAFDLIKKVCEI